MIGKSVFIQKKFDQEILVEEEIGKDVKILNID